jgi:glycosyltransferase involved in cell wall biosynthesis
MKVIYIISHPSAYNTSVGKEKPAIHRDLPNGDWVGIWEGDWGYLIGQKVLASDPTIEYEVWQVDYKADTEFSHRFETGITFRKIPAYLKKHFFGIKIHQSYYSEQILEKLEEERRLHKELIVHIADYSYLHRRIAFHFGNRIPLVANILLDPHLIDIDTESGSLIQRVHRKAIQALLDKYYHALDWIVTMKEDDVPVVQRHTSSKVSFLPWAVNDFSQWQIDMSKEDSRKILNIPEKSFVMFHSSRIDPVKQIDKLIEALAKIKQLDFKLYLSGNGDQENLDALNQLIQTNGLEDKVHFIGYVDKVTLKQYYLASDLFLSVGIRNGEESSVIIGMALEVPILTSDTGLAGFLRKRNAGKIISCTNYESWAAEFEKVILAKEQVPVLNRKVILDHYDSSKMGNGLVDIYKKLASKPS